MSIEIKKYGKFQRYEVKDGEVVYSESDEPANEWERLLDAVMTEMLRQSAIVVSAKPE